MQWRTAGVCPQAFWLHYLSGIGSPLATEAAWEAAGNLSRFLLAVLIGESKAGTHFNRNRPENKNALNLRPPLRPDGTREPGDYMRFDRWEDGIRAARERITSPTYGGGIYAETVTVLEFAHVWAPATDDNDPEAFAAAIEERIASYPKEQETDNMADLVFGKVAHPAYVDKTIPAGNNWAYNDLGPRKPVGVCQHSMVGTQGGSFAWINGGGGAGGALWDYSVGGETDGPALDGVIWRHNNPTGRRAGWANGGSDGLEGDGPLFVRTLGIDAINRDLVSIERSDGGDYNNQRMSPKQFASITGLSAYWFDFAKVPYTEFPFNPHVGCVTHLLHFEFATKACPFPPVRNRIDEIQDRIRAILKAGQTATPPEPGTPPVHPPNPNHDKWPHDWTVADLGARFGQLVRHNPGGSTTELSFDPSGVISNAWAQRSGKHFKRAKNAPRPLHWWVLQADEAGDVKQDIIIFERDWALYRPDPQVAWSWVR